MSDDKRKEELKTENSENLDQLSVEELKKVAGGRWTPSQTIYVCENCNATYDRYQEKCGKCGCRDFSVVIS